MSAAGENPDDWEGLEQCLARFEHETLWRPRAVHHAAGAILYSQYGFFKRLALKYIAAKRGQQTETSRDYDLTDYEALTSFVLEFVQSAAEGAAAAALAAGAGGKSAATWPVTAQPDLFRHRSLCRPISTVSVSAPSNLTVFRLITRSFPGGYDLYSR